MTPQEQIVAWHQSRFPWVYAPGVPFDVVMAAKLCEEAGEVSKETTVGEGLADDLRLLDELGDVLIVASLLAARLGVDIESVRDRRWREVSNR